MATSGTYSFSMDIDEVIEEAMEMIGGKQRLAMSQSLLVVLSTCFSKTGRTVASSCGLLGLQQLQ
jgi:hypothetical protein